MRTNLNSKAAIYIRISTDDQNTAMQNDELLAYCAARGWTVGEVYTDQMSGAKDKRPALDRMMSDARKRKVDVVVVWRFDRFARSTSHLLRALEEFNALGIDFVSLKESVDTSTPMGKMVFTVLAACAELERSVTRERCTAGRKAAKRRGVRFGRPTADVDVAKVEKLRTAGASWRDVAEQLGASKDTLRRAVVRA